MALNSPRLRLLLWIFLLLPASFIVWHALASVLAAPAVFLAGEILELWLPHLVESYSLQSTTMVVGTQFGDTDGTLVRLENADFQVAFNQDTRLLSYSIPFFAALHFASSLDNPMERFGRGLVVLWLLMVFGLICVTLKNLMVTLGEIAFAQGGLPPAPLIALMYQFSVLMIPPVAPLCLWAWECRDSPAMRALVGMTAAKAPQDVPEQP